MPFQISDKNDQIDLAEVAIREKREKEYTAKCNTSTVIELKT